ncbi:MAG: exonuclease subunit SbcD [Chlorobiaceae bacterium]|nr:exonuclease subunit SbcD [Chlorobiaceae bacterium]
MKLLHTSDWHLGRPLYGRSRHREFVEFLDWLAGVVESEAVDALVVSGDIFDTTTPSNRTQELYYRFLGRVSTSRCRHVVVVGGNHDSPTFLDAPKAILRALDVHVLGSMSGAPDDEVLVLQDSRGEPEAVICAVPFLRDRDIRTVEAGESAEDKSRKLIEGIARHYAAVCAVADELRRGLGGELPLIATGHLFTAGAATVEGDGVREIYVGSLARVSRSVFPECIDYLALGHLHVAQPVCGEPHLRYCGSPIPMGFAEAGQRKLVLMVEFEGRRPVVTELPVPCFQQLERLSGSLSELSARILELKAAGSSAWLEIECRGEEPALVVQETLEAAVSGSMLEIRRIRSTRRTQTSLEQHDGEETLEELDRETVFFRCLDARALDEAERPALIECYREVLRSIDEEDTMSGVGGRA